MKDEGGWMKDENELENYRFKIRRFSQQIFLFSNLQSSNRYQSFIFHSSSLIL